MLKMRHLSDLMDKYTKYMNKCFNLWRNLTVMQEIDHPYYIMVQDVVSRLDKKKNYIYYKVLPIIRRCIEMHENNDKEAKEEIHE
jgi:hypothetical protein